MSRCLWSKRSSKPVYDVCLDARLFSAGGIGTFIKAFLWAWEHSPPFRLSILCLPEDRSFFPSPACKIAFRAPLHSGQEQVQLWRHIPLCRVFWSPHINIPLFPIPASHRIVTIHDVHHLDHPERFSLTTRLMAPFVYGAATRFSSQITTVSAFSAGRILCHYPHVASKLHILPPGILPSFTPTPAPSCLREKYQLPHHFLLAVGNGKPHKNLPRLLEALTLLPHPPPLYLVGMNRLPSLPSLLRGKVFLLPPIPDAEMPFLYTAAHVTLFPSLYEGFGLPPLEAMACGCPVVVARTASLPEVCGEAAVYVDPYSAQDIAQGMLRLLSDPLLYAQKQEMGKQQAALFSARKSGKAYCDFLNSLLV